MPRGPLRFREHDLARALRAAAKAGPEWRVRVELSGELTLLRAAGDPAQSAPSNDDGLADELAAWRAKRDGQG